MTLACFINSKMFFMMSEEPSLGFDTLTLFMCDLTVYSWLVLIDSNATRAALLLLHDLFEIVHAYYILE